MVSVEGAVTVAEVVPPITPEPAAARELLNLVVVRDFWNPSLSFSITTEVGSS
jgi:hypothetical protein